MGDVLSLQLPLLQRGSNLWAFVLGQSSLFATRFPPMGDFYSLQLPLLQRGSQSCTFVLGTIHRLVLA